MKKLSILFVCLFAMIATSLSVKAQEVTILLNPGWTWIGYPGTDTLDFATAFGSFTPMEGDIIKAQVGSAEFYDGYGWYGTMATIMPGKGYMYRSNRTEPVAVTFLMQPDMQVSVTTATPTNVTQNSVTCGGTVTNTGNATVIARGVCWSTQSNPTIANSHTTNGEGAGNFSSSVSGLTINTVYYIRAYAVTESGVTYGNEVSFATESGGTGGDHAYVDLSLPSGLLWATCNVGAEMPEGYGDYFAWGETQPKDTYNWSTYQYCMGSYNTLTKYCSDPGYGYNGFTDNLTTLLPEDDAATANWGGDWRMPTESEWEELYNNTTVIWTQQNGVKGRLFTASNGNSLFLPTAGFFNGSSFNIVGNYSFYWSSSLYSYPNSALSFYFRPDEYYMVSYSRAMGFSVRPVRSSGQN